MEAIEVVARLGTTVLDVSYVTDGRYTIAGQDYVLEVPPGPPAVFRVGLVDVIARRAPAPRRSVPAPPLPGDRRTLGYLVLSLTAHLALWSALPDPERSMPGAGGSELSVDEGTFVMRTVASTTEVGDSPDDATNGSGSPSAGDAGAAGSKTSRAATGHIQVADRVEVKRLARVEAIEAARQGGILGSASISSGFEAITGTADLSSGFDTADVHGPLYGGIGEGGTSFGIARSGFGTGAGCTGTDCNGIIGVGRYGTLSNGIAGGGTGWGGLLAGEFGTMGGGAGTGQGFPGGRAIGGLRRRTTRWPTVVMCGRPSCVNAIGGLDKAIIRRYIRRELPKIQYCYEKELLATPGLAGTAKTEFMIAPDGTVQTSTASGIGEPVASCIAGVIKNIKFPRATDGSTQVTYPFELRSAGN